MPPGVNHGVVMASATLLVMLVFSWLSTNRVDCVFAIGCVNFCTPFDKILGFRAIVACGLKSPAMSVSHGVCATESQTKSMEFSFVPSISSIVSKTVSTLCACVYKNHPIPSGGFSSKQQPTLSRNTLSMADSESKYTTSMPIF